MSKSQALFPFDAYRYVYEQNVNTLKHHLKVGFVMPFINLRTHTEREENARWEKEKQTGPVDPDVVLKAFHDKLTREWTHEYVSMRIYSPLVQEYPFLPQLLKDACCTHRRMMFHGKVVFDPNADEQDADQLFFQFCQLLLNEVTRDVMNELHLFCETDDLALQGRNHSRLISIVQNCIERSVELCDAATFEACSFKWKDASDMHADSDVGIKGGDYVSQSDMSTAIEKISNSLEVFVEQSQRSEQERSNHAAQDEDFRNSLAASLSQIRLQVSSMTGAVHGLTEATEKVCGAVVNFRDDIMDGRDNAVSARRDERDREEEQRGRFEHKVEQSIQQVAEHIEDSVVKINQQVDKSKVYTVEHVDALKEKLAEQQRLIQSMSEQMHQMELAVRSIKIAAVAAAAGAVEQQQARRPADHAAAPFIAIGVDAREGEPDA
jgi:hypothetical protein